MITNHFEEPISSSVLGNKNESDESRERIEPVI